MARYRRPQCCVLEPIAKPSHAEESGLCNVLGTLSARSLFLRTSTSFVAELAFLGHSDINYVLNTGVLGAKIEGGAYAEGI